MLQQIYLIRHGKTKSNEKGQLLGWQDIPLSSAGLKEAHMIGEHFCNIDYASVYSSDLTRCMQTATSLTSGRGKTVVQEKSLREINFGQWELATWNQLKNDRIFKQWQLDAASVTIPGGESLAEVKVRSIETFDRICNQHSGENIVIVTHGGIIKIIISHLFKIPSSLMTKIIIHNASITMLWRHEKEYYLEKLNDISHL